MRILVLLTSVALAAAAAPRSPITNNAEWKNGRPIALPKVTRPKVESVFLYRPETNWTYSHHASITFFKDRFFAIWSNSRKDEDAPGQRVLLATSKDFTHWTEPRPLVDSVTDSNGVERVLTAAGVHQHGGTLVAYFGNYGPNKETTHLQAIITTDGEHWSAVREMGVPVNPNHGPQRTASGRLIIAGNISFPYTDDPTGLAGWQMTGIYPTDMAATIKDDPASFWEVAKQQGWSAALCEGSFYQTDDGVLHMPLRNTAGQSAHRLWLTESRDNGATWSTPIETEFSDTNAKFHFGRLPDGRFFYVGNPIGGGRTPLVLSLSRDGVSFEQHFILGETPYQRRRPGAAKGGEYGYPHTLIHDGYLHVIVSRQKEAVEVLRVGLNELGAVSGAANPVPSPEERATVEPKLRAGVLLNPGKGWSAGGLPERHPKEVRDLLGMGVMRLDWASLEPQEGQFNWTALDHFLDSWGRLGKVCNVGVMCANTHSRDPDGYVTPRWVFEAGAKKTEILLNPQQSTTGTPGRKVAPVFDDPVFLAKFASFLREFAQRYDGDPRIAVLDIRSYGNWGEAHMHPFGVPDIAPEKFRLHVQMHLDAFKKTQLCLSRNAHLGRFGPLKPVFDWAVLEKRIAPRRDGICGNSDGRETAIGFGIAPGVFELFDNYDGVKRRGWWDGQKDKGGMGFTLEECVENGKPTWVDLGRGGQSGLRMVRENRELIERLSSRIGYHFHLQRAVWPHRVGRDGFEVQLTWTNLGVAPIYVPCAVAMALLDDTGTRVATHWPAQCRPQAWVPGEPVLEKARLKFPDVPPGQYRLALALTRQAHDASPYVRLGTELPGVNGWYVLGETQVAP